ncbi:MAG: RNA-binding protein [Nostocoides sp.]
MGLRFPSDIDAWSRWHERRHMVRLVKNRALAGVSRSSSPRSLHVVGGSSEADIVIVIESRSPTTLTALVAPIRHLDPARVALVAPFDPNGLLPSAPWHTNVVDEADLLSAVPGMALGVSAGAYLPGGRALLHATTTAHRPFVVVQHGLLTPLAPPLAPECHLLAWTEADAYFWRSGRGDVTSEVVGSTLLADAAARPLNVNPSAATTYLGQLHAAELPRVALARQADTFCREHGAVYRPHPSEQDRTSRAILALMHRRGVAIDDGKTPLKDLAAPIVSVFSTGVLEAAAAGLPAWVHYPNAPAWLGEFWERYGMAPFGGEPTPPPAGIEGEPAKTLAERITALAAGSR